MILLCHNSNNKGRRRHGNSAKNKKSIKRKEKEEKKHNTKQRSGFLKDGSVGLMDGLGGNRGGHFGLQRRQCQQPQFRLSPLLYCCQIHRKARDKEERRVVQICALVIIGLYHTVSDSIEEDGEIVSILCSYRQRKREDKYKEELRKKKYLYFWGKEY